MGRGKGIIVGRKCPRIQNCPTCGQMRVHHPNNDYYKCPVRPEVIAALKAYKGANGVRWKSKLVAEWQSGNCSQELQEARNVIGPRRLHKVKI